MAFDGDQLKRVARLARLRIDPDQLAARSADIDRVLCLFDGLAQAPVNGVEPMAHPLGMAAELRSDEVTEGNMAKRLLALAPDAQADLYLVPKVLE